MQSRRAELLGCQVEFWLISASEQYGKIIYLTELSGMVLMISLKYDSY